MSNKITIEAVITYGALILYGPLLMAGNEMKPVPLRLALFSLSFLCLGRAALALARARRKSGNAL